MNALMATQAEIHGVAHVTGGGLGGRLAKLMPPGLGAQIERTSWTIPPIFGIVQKAGAIEEKEMFCALNMGIGFVLAAPQTSLSAVREAFPDALEIGRVVKSSTPFELQ
jgi:phosphoribosylformylglycinamidine cyclo-ligase